MGEPVIEMYIDGFDYEYKIKKNNVQRKSENSKLIGIKVRLYRLLLFMNVYCECVYRWI
jgi:hypothetical protein